MTGTADTEAEEFNKIYNLDVVVVPTNRPVVRTDENDLVYLNESEKFDAILNEIKTMYHKGQPILVGTVSIEKSEKLSAILLRNGIKHEVLNAKNHAREALIISEAGAKGAVTIATNMAAAAPILNSAATRNSAPDERQVQMLPKKNTEKSLTANTNDGYRTTRK